MGCNTKKTNNYSMPKQNSYEYFQARSAMFWYKLNKFYYYIYWVSLLNCALVYGFFVIFSFLFVLSPHRIPQGSSESIPV